MAKKRVLIADDSELIRTLVCQALSMEPDIEVVAAASNGKEAVDLCQAMHPDIVILDVQMPVMDGLQALAMLHDQDPSLPVLMFSAISSQAANTTLEALQLGAIDFLTKPKNVGSLKQTRQRIREQLVPKINAFCRRPGREPLKVELPRTRTEVKLRPCSAVVIAISTGGPPALGTVLPALPADLPVPIFVVQHMPAVFTTRLAERLDLECPNQVLEARGHTTAKPGQIIIAPGDYHMVLRKPGNEVRIHLNQDAPENSCRPAADPLFRSAAKIYGKDLLAVVMTGMGKDGMAGCDAVRAAGGQVLIQDQETSSIWGMPGAVAHAKLHHDCQPLSALAKAIAASALSDRQAVS